MKTENDGTFSLELTRERVLVLTMVFNTSKDDKGLIKELVDTGLWDSYLDMIREMSRNVHERGMCEDPDCTDNYERPNNFKSITSPYGKKEEGKRGSIS